MNNKTHPSRIKILFPPVRRYTLLYEKAPGIQELYTISPPIEENSQSFTAYAFGKGVRTFKREKVLDIN